MAHMAGMVKRQEEIGGYHQVMTVERIAEGFSALPGVRAVALSGSRTSAIKDSSSDWDLYIYSDSPIAKDERKRLYDALSLTSRISISFFEEGDEAEDGEGNVFDLMMRSTAWTEGEVDNVYRNHHAKIGYTTCILYNIATSRMLCDRDGWLSRLQDEITGGYPEELRRNIIHDNLTVIDGAFSSPFIKQLELAVMRDDIVSQNHRLSAIIASYFDALFAYNRVYHPGEKKLMRYAGLLCNRLPRGFDEDIPAMIGAIGTEGLLPRTKAAIASLRDLVEAG